MIPIVYYLSICYLSVGKVTKHFIKHFVTSIETFRPSSIRKGNNTIYFDYLLANYYYFYIILCVVLCCVVLCCVVLCCVVLCCVVLCCVVLCCVVLCCVVLCCVLINIKFQLSPSENLM